MLKIQSEVTVNQVCAQEIIDFMLNCTDTDYAQWWPGVHLAFHTIERFPNSLGNIVYFDEYVGNYRLKFKGVVTELIPNRKIVWQMMKGILLPAWLELDFTNQPGSVHITHSLRVGLTGPGKIFDPLIRLYFSERFIEALDEHARKEFPMLGALLVARK